MKTINDWSLKASTFVIAAAMAADPGMAHAQGIGGVANTVNANLERIPQLIGLVAYIAGGAIGIAGIFKLKQHVDQPNQVGLKDGLIRLVAGGGLIALPFVLETMIQTLGGGNQTNLTRPTF